MSEEVIDLCSASLVLSAGAERRASALAAGRTGGKMTDVADLAATLSQCLRQFRVLEARGISRVLAVDYPIAQDFSDLLDSYHAFFMEMSPAIATKRKPTPFSLDRDSVSWIEAERRRLRELWSDGWRLRPLMNLFAVSYWAVAQYDGFRAAVWLRELIRLLPPPYSGATTIQGLDDILALYLGQEPKPTRHPLSLYAELDRASQALQSVLDQSPLELVRHYIPASLDLVPGDSPT